MSSPASSIPREDVLMICDFMTLLATLGVLALHAEAYTMFGSRRFVRPVRSPWRPAPPPPSYYTAYQPAPYVPSSNDYDDELPDDGGALYSDTVNYYPPPRYYYGRTMDPVDDIQMEMRNEERGADLPIGQETWFESQSAAQAAAAERAAANDAFMQNLILAEMYRNQEPNNQYYGYDYGNNAGFADEEERELKSLSQVKRADSKQQKVPATPSPSPATVKPFVGMKEVPMLRPPSPARGSKTAMPAPTSGGHQPSVYDTIKQLLSLESKDGNKAHHEGARATRRAPPQKRFVSNEESLVRQLSGLKNKVTA
ncbi:hypothetical protein B566_EDAN006130 [Ephemera danica]|nr:hypothetical protein B566_EDAN006130 [Ephemera danica]